MTVKLNLKPEIEASLSARAQARGMELEEYLLSLVEDAAAQASSGVTKSARENAVRRMLEFGENYHLSLGEPATRRFLHEGHRF